MSRRATASTTPRWRAGTARSRASSGSTSSSPATPRTSSSTTSSLLQPGSLHSPSTTSRPQNSSSQPGLIKQHEPRVCPRVASLPRTPSGHRLSTGIGGAQRQDFDETTATTIDFDKLDEPSNLSTKSDQAHTPLPTCPPPSRVHPSLTNKASTLPSSPPTPCSIDAHRQRQTSRSFFK